MVRDEAPAATTGGFNGKRNVTARKSVRLEAPGQFLRSGPTSLVAAEIHLGLKASGLCDGWLHCNIQVVCHAAAHKISCNIKGLSRGFGTLQEAPPLISHRQPKN
jgi:hypothetical protein